MPLREKILTSTIVPSMPGGHLSEASRTSPAFSPKIARSSFSSGVSCVSPFGVTLPTRMSPGLTVGADPDDARLVEVAQRVLRDVRDVARDLLGAELGVAGLDVELLDVDRREEVVLDQALGDQDRVLVVVAAPGHEGDEHVAAEGELALRGARAVGEDLAPLDPVALVDDRLLVDAGVLVGAAELRQRIDVRAELLAAPPVSAGPPSTRTMMRSESTWSTTPAALGEDDGARVPGHRRLEAGADERRLDLEERHGLALHVRAHEGAVGVVVLEERDERRRDRDELLGRDVLVVDLVAVGRDELAVEAGDDPLFLDAARGVGLGVGLRDRVVLLFPRREVEGVRVGVGRTLVVPADALVLLLELLLLDDLAELEGGVADRR